jgi:hypothetical protein
MRRLITKIDITTVEVATTLPTKLLDIITSTFFGTLTFESNFSGRDFLMEAVKESLLQRLGER